MVVTKWVGPAVKLISLMLLSLLNVRVFTEVTFWHSAEYGIYTEVNLIPRNSALFLDTELRINSALFLYTELRIFSAKIRQSIK